MANRKNRKDSPGEAVRLSRLLKIFFIVFFAILVVTVGGTAAYYLITLDLPGIDALKDYRPSIASRVLDENDELIDEFLDRKSVV
jgi:membrane carboxypeptidase/penicillin-binding protein